MIHTTPFRLVALLVATVLMVVAATPAPAEAIEPLAIVAIVGLALAGIILVAYLVVANVEGKSAGIGPVVWLACAADGCTSIPADAALVLAAPAPPIERQSP
jgi:hypothetical protein